MDRRNFIRSLIGGVAATAAVRTFPFRVFSFPSEPILAPELATIYYSKEALETLKNSLQFHNVMPFDGKKFYGYIHPLALRDIITDRFRGRTIDLFKYRMAS